MKINNSFCLILFVTSCLLQDVAGSSSSMSSKKSSIWNSLKASQSMELTRIKRRSRGWRRRSRGFRFGGGMSYGNPMGMGFMSQGQGRKEYPLSLLLGSAAGKMIKSLIAKGLLTAVFGMTGLRGYGHGNDFPVITNSFPIPPDGGRR